MKKILKNIFVYILAIMNPKSVVYLANRRLETKKLYNNACKSIVRSQEMSNEIIAKLKLLEEKA